MSGVSSGASAGGGNASHRGIDHERINREMTQGMKSLEDGGQIGAGLDRQIHGWLFRNYAAAIPLIVVGSVATWEMKDPIQFGPGSIWHFIVDGGINSLASIGGAAIYMMAARYRKPPSPLVFAVLCVMVFATTLAASVVESITALAIVTGISMFALIRGHNTRNAIMREQMESMDALQDNPRFPGESLRAWVIAIVATAVFCGGLWIYDRPHKANLAYQQERKAAQKQKAASQSDQP